MLSDALKGAAQDRLFEIAQFGRVMGTVNYEV
jgi:hypothetical protein